MQELGLEIVEKAEMSNDELQFVCSLLERHKPRKIVEIGVAAGGTSVAILEMLNSFDIPVEMYSLDLSKEYYRDRTKKTGYLIDEWEGNIGKHIKHQKMFGDYAVNFLETIGKNIDFLILDTVHSLPGEILDFLAFFPFLTNNAIVVLHDIILNHLSVNKDAYATQVLLDSVVADKMIPIVEGKRYPGIGAFRLNSDTEKYMEDVFNSLLITWKYLPSNQEVTMYRTWYARYYSRKQIYIFDEAVQYNNATFRLARKREMDKFKILYDFVNQMKDKDVYIYGCGICGQKFKNLILACGINFKQFIISHKEEGQSVLSIDEAITKGIFLNKKMVVLIGTDSDKKSEIVEILNRLEIRNRIIPDDPVLSIVKNIEMYNGDLI